ncbi:MAG: hypothetical protein IPK15_03770 [Verrucomicrobia bacterium]|nr:hypothetical protein [Verrucomicrobiota bacterium]
MKIKHGILLLVFVTLIGVYMVWSNSQKMRSPISPAEKAAIQRALASTKYLIGTNIIEIERLRPDGVKVTTKSEVGKGGDLLEMDEKGGEWFVTRKGMWVE